MVALETYRKKRDFKTTTEPRGRKACKAGNSFVIQKHDATRLHYDLRLEMDGVLKSWAVTRGPSLVPSEKRLAVHVEDHPLEYGEFEGTIPKGEYGGGTVIVWDHGTWTPVFDQKYGYAKGHLEFELYGEKLSGRWHLVRMHGRPREKRENWLLIKAEDDAARTESDPDILEERPESVKTGREIADVAGEEPGWSSKTGKISKKKSANGKATKAAQESARDTAPDIPDPSSIKAARKAPLPPFVEPTLATLAPKPPMGERWIHEIKFDGYRLQARLEAGRVKLFTRNGLDWTKKFGKEIVAAFQDLPIGTALIDGELVVETAGGASNFSALQADLSDNRTDRFVFYVFDLLYLDGFDLRNLPLIGRKAILEKVVADTTARIRYSGHFEENGPLILEHACRLSLEGIVSKRRDAPYRSGRVKDWIKAKCSQRQEFVIAGYVPSTTSRKAIGSLVMGVYNGKKLEHVGRVGTGYSTSVAEDLFRRLERIRVPESPFAERLSADAARQVRYVKPQLVAEVEFRAWTADNNLRHAAFRGLREDKDPREVMRETPKSKASSQPERPKVKLTHPDRIYWPEEGVTKQGLADYYTEVWKYIAPFVVARPLALLRGPEGITGQSFFQKHSWKGLNSNIVLVEDPKDKDDEPLISINDLDGLIGLVQSAVLEIHPWGSTIADWERPDMIIMDLDPGEGVPWEQVIAGAQETRQRLEQAGLSAFIKTSGGKGLHVVAPLKPKAAWPEVKAFTKALADSMASDSPDRYVSTITKSRRTGKILIDYLRNQRGMTAVAPYSTRARPGAAVSMPLEWDELTPGIGPAYFTILNTPTRLASIKCDPWADFRAAAVPIEKQTKKRA
ncbi:DNA ligase D [Phyllobacterium sp. LjRoot231]|uniref:DNA ligase D n=1 Tax=Phyllobacterium sp. LjRoot231 TaxID=3342289 RepID=UPI003ED03561